MPFLYLCFFILFVFVNKSYANGYYGTLPHLSSAIYGFFWTKGDADFVMGSLNYNGNAISSIPVELSGISPGNLYLKAKYCRTTNYVPYNIVGYDYYIFLPKEVMTSSGKSIPISINTLPSDTTAIDRGTYYALYKKEPDKRVGSTSARCYDNGYIMNFNTVQFNTSLRFDVSNLGVGNHSGNIQMRLGFASYHSDYLNHNVLSRWSTNDIDGISTTQALLPFDITINNKCEITPTTIEFAHGAHSITSANGSTISQSININCQLPSDVKSKITLKSLSSPTTQYTDGVGVGLGNGWDSILKVEEVNISDTSPNAEVTIQGNRSLTIKSTLKNTSNSQPGKLSGAAIMEVSLP